METIGERIKNLRKRKSLNQKDFSRAIGISQGALSDIEKDKSKPSVDTIIAISEKFGISANLILTGKDIKSDIISSDLKEYIELSQELKEKGYEAKDIKNLIKLIEDITLKNNSQQID